MSRGKRGMALSGSDNYGWVSSEESLLIDPDGGVSAFTFEDGVSNANAVVSIIGDVAGIGLDVFTKINDPQYDKEIQQLVLEGKNLDNQFKTAQAEFMSARTSLDKMEAEIRLSELKQQQQLLAKNAVAVADGIKADGIGTKVNPNIIIGAGVVGVLGLAYIFKGK